MFVIEIPYFNLNHIYNSGQAPRWICLSKSDEKSKYVIPYKDKALKIEQQRNKFDWTKYRFVMNCSEQDFYDIWFKYFDLSFDYHEENLRIKRLGKKFKVAANRGHGIHILNQDPFEAYVHSKLISKVGLHKAAELMNRIAQTYGIEHKQSMREAGRITWYEWPTPESMLEKLNKEKRSSGKVKPFLKKLCDAIVNDSFDITQSDNELFRLFGMHDISAFPINDIEDILDVNFDCEPEEFADWYLDEIENKGLVYMYFIHHIFNRTEEVKVYGTY